MKGVEEETTTRIYSIENELIRKCVEYSEPKGVKIEYEYNYDTNKHITKVSSNGESTVYFVEWIWDNNNLSQAVVEYVLTPVNYVERYRYEYKHDKKHKGKFPNFHLSCFQLGCVSGIDEILMAEGYFGNSISADLPVREFFDNNLTREFSYELDKYGYVEKISQINNGKVVEDYYFTWN